MGVWSRLRFLVSASDIAQIQRERKVAVLILRRRCEGARQMAVESGRADFEAFSAAVDVPRRAAGGAFFPRHMPRFERRAQFDMQIASLRNPDARETKLEMRREPVELEPIAGDAQIVDDIAKI